VSRRSLLLVTGASGVGKTTAVEAVAARARPGVAVFHFDRIGVPDAETLEREYGSGAAWRASALGRWMDRLRGEPAPVAVLDGQVEPALVEGRRDGDRTAAAVLLDCERGVREARLRGRGRPELASHEMHAWAAYLRGQADALGIPVIDTTGRTPEEVADALEARMRTLPRSAGGGGVDLPAASSG
jgi:hypothetical protein